MSSGVRFNIIGTQTNDNAPAGSVGELISSVIASGSAVTQTFNTAVNVTSITLTPGDWDVWGNVAFPTIGTAWQAIAGWVSTTSATIPDNSLWAAIGLSTGTFGASSGIPVPQQRFSVNTNTTVYLSSFGNGSSGNGTVCGGIYARRVR